MDIAIVTGASSSLGLAISKRLIQLGFRVYGLGGDYTDCSLNNVNFKPLSCDLGDADAVEAACRSILEKEKGVYVLVHNAKYFGRNPFPEMDNREMERILKINLLCPLVLSRTLAGSLMALQGYIIQLGSPYAETSRGGPAGAAVSGGLKWMGEVLFQDLRSHGVRVCHISPEPNRGRDPRTVVRPGARLEATIDPDAVAQAIEQILQSPFGNIVTEMIMRPLRVLEPDHDPVVRLPYPEPKPVPYTVPREMIEAEEQLEDEAIEKNQERRKRKRQRGKPREDQQEDSQPKSTDSQPKSTGSQPESTGPSGDSRRPDKRSERSTKSASADQRKTDSDKRRTASGNKPAPEKQDPPSNESRADSGKPARSRRRGRRKPKPPLTAVGFLDRTTPQKDSGSTPPASKPEPAKAREPAHKPDNATSSDAKPAREATKKAAKKAPRKAAKKARPAKKATSAEDKPARKTARKSTATKKRPARKRAAKKAAASDENKSD